MNIDLPTLIALLRQYYDSFEKLLYVMAALFGIFGAFNVYIMYQQGHHGAKQALFNLVFGILLIILAPLVLRQLIK